MVWSTAITWHVISDVRAIYWSFDSSSDISFMLPSSRRLDGSFCVSAYGSCLFQGSFILCSWFVNIKFFVIYFVMMFGLLIALFVLFSVLVYECLWVLNVYAPCSLRHSAVSEVNSYMIYLIVFDLFYWYMLGFVICIDYAFCFLVCFLYRQFWRGFDFSTNDE